MFRRSPDEQLARVATCSAGREGGLLPGLRWRRSCRSTSSGPGGRESVVAIWLPAVQHAVTRALLPLRPRACGLLVGAAVAEKQRGAMLR
jgi:hypothetical protein